MKQFTHPRFRLAWLLVLIGVLNGLFWTIYRGHYENSLLQTQITLDFEDTRSLADAFGIPQTKLLADYKARGATSLAIYNQTLGTLRDSGASPFRRARSPRNLRRARHS